MKSIHKKIHQFIRGNLSEEETDHLHQVLLNKKIWRDYLITELTAYQIRFDNSSDMGQMIERSISRFSSDNGHPPC